MEADKLVLDEAMLFRMTAVSGESNNQSDHGFHGLLPGPLLLHLAARRVLETRVSKLGKEQCVSNAYLVTARRNLDLMVDLAVTCSTHDVKWKRKFAAPQRNFVCFTM